MTISFPDPSLPLSVPLNKGNKGSQNGIVQMIGCFLFNLLKNVYWADTMVCIYPIIVSCILARLGARQNKCPTRIVLPYHTWRHLHIYRMTPNMFNVDLRDRISLSWFVHRLYHEKKTWTITTVRNSRFFFLWFWNFNLEASITDFCTQVILAEPVLQTSSRFREIFAFAFTAQGTIRWETLERRLGHEISI